MHGIPVHGIADPPRHIPQLLAVGGDDLTTSDFFLVKLSSREKPIKSTSKMFHINNWSKIVVVVVVAAVFEVIQRLPQNKTEKKNQSIDACCDMFKGHSSQFSNTSWVTWLKESKRIKVDETLIHKGNWSLHETSQPEPPGFLGRPAAN